ncbi:MAG: response regulator transcription factor [Anaerolineae bacterium]|nr:response regulator transcription factor [Anaerolineae bacterium]
MYKILIVDDDLETVGMIEEFLDREGYIVSKAFTSREALSLVERDTPDLLVINTMLSSGMDGLTLCRRLRNDARTATAPIIFLTDQGNHHAGADALEAGGDDYIRKPFALRELGARIRAHLRRVSGNIMDGLPTLRIIPDNLTVFINERQALLTQVEFELLTYLCNTPHQLHSTQDLLSDVWHYPMGTGDAALVRNHIRNLRRKLEDDPERPTIIQSRHGRGYAVRAKVYVETSTVSSAR